MQVQYHIGQNFEIGKLIVQNQEKNDWGKSIVDTLSKDINKIIDGVKGYSPQNLWRMRQFYLDYKGNTDLLELALTIPWGQNLLIMHQIKDVKEKYYLNATNKLGWSRAVLLKKIEEIIGPEKIVLIGRYSNISQLEATINRMGILSPQQKMEWQIIKENKRECTDKSYYLKAKKDAFVLEVSMYGVSDTGKRICIRFCHNLYPKR